MKYFILFGDNDYELEIEQYDSEREVLSRIAEIKENRPDSKIHVIKGEKMEIVPSYALKSGAGK